MRPRLKLFYPPSMTAYDYKDRKAFEIFEQLGIGKRTWEHYVHMLHNPDSTTSVKFLSTQRVIVLPHWRHRKPEDNYAFAVQAYLELKEHADLY